MPKARIEDLLHRRSDLGTYLVHLTRDSSNGQQTWFADDALLNILDEQQVGAYRSLGMAPDRAKKALRETVSHQRVACFTETPLEQVWMMTEEIEGRRQSFSSYGVVFAKAACRRSGCNPVWYLNQTPGFTWFLQPAVESMVTDAIRRATSARTLDPALLAAEPIFQLTPFLEQMGTWNGSQKEFWWEREWRHSGHFAFKPRAVVAVFGPEQRHEALRADIANLSTEWRRREVPILDPRWGLERMIAALARVDNRDAGPFPV